MGTADVVEIIGLLRSAGVATWLAGGWACDALLGEQTRVHADLDLLVAEQDRGRACEVLEQHGFALAEEFDAGLMSLALELLDRRRRRKVALHLVDIAADAPGEWAVSLGERMQSLGLDSAELFATGTVAGRELPCLSPAALLALHTGYEPREEDRRDISVMCARFSLPAPPGYERALDAA
jgi:lincosamide nucleotidyltransferase A/C/D/E